MALDLPDSKTSFLIVIAFLFAFASARFCYHIITVRRQRSYFAKQHGCKPAQSSCLKRPWLFGIDYMLEQAMIIQEHKFAERIRHSFQQYGITYTGRILDKPFIATLDPLNLEAIMKTRFDDYNIIPGRGKLVRVLFGDGVFSTNGHDWRQSRLLVRAGMQNFSYEPERLEEHATAFLNTLRQSDGRKIDFVEPTFAYTIDTATDIIFGRSTKVQTAESPEGQQFARAFTYLGKMARILTIFIAQVPGLAYLQFGREYLRMQRTAFDYVDSCVEKALHQDPKTEVHVKSIADGLARRTRDAERVRSELLNILLAGHDTVGIALSEMFYCLARKPSVWNRLRAEAHLVLEGRLPSQADLKKMTYLSWVINEAIRVRPTLSVHARRANKATVLPRGGGSAGDEPLFVAKDQYVVYSNYALYRNPSVFGDDIDEFKPERWETARPKTFEFLNFGAGPRSCPGKEMGWTMLAYITARLAQEVEEVLPMDDRPWQEAKAFSFHNRHGIHLAIRMKGDTHSGS